VRKGLVVKAMREDPAEVRKGDIALFHFREVQYVCLEGKKQKGKEEKGRDCPLLKKKEGLVRKRGKFHRSVAKGASSSHSRRFFAEREGAIEKKI